MKDHIGFIQSVQKLKESSKHAIIDGEDYSLDELKQYLHVEREIESKLTTLIKESSNKNNSQLILVCGNVGDGKSHILSYLSKNIQKEFKIHNDATEAFNPGESFIQTLDKLLVNFKDENLGKANDKIILAINLGTLNNFLEAQKEKYQKLFDFVHSKGILDSDDIQDDRFDSSSYFQYVNFTDYQLYELTEEGTTSEVVEQLFDKVFKSSKKNPIYSAFQKFKKEFDHLNSPIVYNYEFLSDDSNRVLIIKLMIKAIVKSKGIVSLRSILNFIYDIIVPVKFQTDNDKELKKLHNKISAEIYSKNILPNYIFEHPELSNLFSIIAEEDPCNIRSEGIDDSIFRVINTEDIQKYANHNYGNKLEKGTLFSFLPELQKNKSELAKLHARLLYFKDSEMYGLEDKSYHEYIRYLYHLNKGNKPYIKRLYNLVIDACRRWNGNPNEKNTIIIEIGQKQKKYRILQDFNPSPNPTFLTNKETVIRKFSPQLKVVFKDRDKKDVTLYIDNGLLKLLNKVTQGYRPNKLDKNSYINFINFLDSLIHAQSDITTLKIDEVNIGKSIDYTFSIDSFEENTFQKV